ncbi:Leucine Rich repeat [Novymonas esmeraldas]|uniref:Leucine Rich repeat n=1 Tax=Novymonas esmeraldas TaxID=1808958 RepID=A0AAW0EXD7_9TRYP
MYTSLGISAEQVYGDMYSAWLRDTHEKNTPDVKRLYTTMIENGFGEQQVLLRRQRLGANFISSLAPLLHQCSLVKLDLHGNMLRDVGCELLIHVLRDMPQLSYLDLGANAIGCSSVVAGGIGGVVGGGASGGVKGKGGVGGGAGGAAASRSGGGGGGGGGGSGGGAAASGGRISSSYLNAMQGLGSAIAQHKRLTVLVLGSAREEAYTNQIEVTGAMVVLEGCLLSRTLKRLDLSGNPFAMNGDAPLGDAPVLRRGQDSTVGGGGGGGGATSASVGAATANTSPGGTAAVTRIGSASQEVDRVAAAGGGGAAAAAAGYGVRAAPRTPVHLLAQLLRTSLNLTHLTLRSVGLTDGGAALLFDAAGSSRVLQQLDLSANGLSARVADVAGLLLQQRTAAVRSGALGCTLQSIVLAHNDLWDRGAAAAEAHRGSFGIGGAAGRADERASGTATTMSRHVSRTRALRDVVSSDVNDASPSDTHPLHRESVPGLVLLSALSHDQFITTLVLDHCEMDDTALVTLCRSLMTNAMLKVLSVRHNRLSADGVVQLGRALCRHPCLERLLLSGNPIEDEGACALATALGQPDASLIELDVAQTWLGDRGLIAIGVALQTNASLRVLHVSDNHFSHNGGASFAALMENNTVVVRCDLGATSVPHHVVLRLGRTTSRNRARADNADADALKAEVVRLHYQKYKLLEAHLELEALRESNAEVKRTTENFDLQTKQDQGDFVKRIRELEEQVENAKQQEVRYTEQKAKLEADLIKAEHAHAEDMSFVAERLAVEVGLREKAEAEFQELQRELTGWQENGPEREAQKREKLAALKSDQEAWATQRKGYRDRTLELQQQVAALEAVAAASASKGMSKKRKKSAKA